MNQDSRLLLNALLDEYYDELVLMHENSHGAEGYFAAEIRDFVRTVLIIDNTLKFDFVAMAESFIPFHRFIELCA